MAGADEARIRDPRHFRSVAEARPIQLSERIAPRLYDARRRWVVGSGANIVWGEHWRASQVDPDADKWAGSRSGAIPVAATHLYKVS